MAAFASLGDEKKIKEVIYYISINTPNAKAANDFIANYAFPTKFLTKDIFKTSEK